MTIFGASGVTRSVAHRRDLRAQNQSTDATTAVARIATATAAQKKRGVGSVIE